MKRRSFIQTSGFLGLQAAMPWGDVYAQGQKSKQFLQKKASDNMLFPRPAHGAELAISPVGLAWLPCPGSAAYRVEIYDQSGSMIYEKNVGADPVHIPDRVFPAGTYEWDIVALDPDGTDIARHGKQTYTILANAAELPWIEPRELLSRVPEGHSRILYPKANLPRLRATLNSSRANSWAACKAAGDRALGKGIPTFPTYHTIQDTNTSRLEYGRYFAYIRGYIDGALMDLSLAYLMSEDEKYANAAKKILLEIASWPHTDEDVTSVRAKWGDEVGLSYSKCAHIAYDWLYPSFSTEERQQVFTMCQARAWQTYRRLKGKNYLTYPGESHDGRLIAYLSDMSLAMAGETKDAEVWLEYSLKALLTFYPHWGGIDGGWAEGVPYGLWYNTFYIPAFESLRQLADYDLWQRPFFNQIRYFFFYCTANHGEIRPFGDSAENGGPGVNRGSGYAELMAFHAHRYNDPNIGWWVNQIPGYRNQQRGKLAMLHEDKLPSKVPTDLPHSRVFQSVGWAGLHSDITQPERDTCLLFKSSPYGSVSHSHADQNAFAIMKGGTALAIPSGYYGPSYGKPHHAEWTRSTKANNCILVDGQGQKIRTATGGSIVAFTDTPGASYVAGDATPGYMGKLTRWVRHILLLRPGLILLLDDIEAPSASRFQWMLHAFDEMKLTENQIISQRKNATLNITLACPQQIQISQTDQFEPPYNHGIPEAYHKDVANHWHVTAETQNNTKQTRFAAVMGVSQKNEDFELQIQKTQGWLGAIATGEFGQVEGWIRYEPSAKPPKALSQENGSVHIWGKDRDERIFRI